MKNAECRPQQRPFHTVALAAVLLATTALGACSPYPEIRATTTNSGDARIFTKIADVRKVIAEKRGELFDKIANEHTKQTLLGGLIFGGLGTAAVGGIYGAHRDLIAGGLATAGLTYGAGQLSTERGYDAVYLAGITALDCIDNTLGPVAASMTVLRDANAELKRRIDILNQIITNAQSTLSGSKGTEISKVSEAVSTAKKTRDAAQASYDQAERKTGNESELANSAVPALTAVDREITRQIMERRPSLEQYFAVLQSVPGVGMKDVTIPAKVAQPAEAAATMQNFTQNRPPFELDKAGADALIKQLTEAETDVNNAKAAVDKLDKSITLPDTFQISACTVLAPDLIAADITFKPTDTIDMLTTDSRPVQILGGGKSDSFALVWEKNVPNLSANPSGLRSILIQTNGVAAGTYTLHVTSVMTGKSAPLTLTVKAQ